MHRTSPPISGRVAAGLCGGRPWRPGSGVLALAALVVAGGCLSLKHTPKAKEVRQPAARHEPPAYDVWGGPVSRAEADRLMKTREGRERLSPANGAVKVDADLLELGEKAFYEETFGNEVFLTDVMGMMAGPLKPGDLLQALLDLKGAGTTNLRVPLAEDATIGGRTFRKGEVIDTGLDVPKGAQHPLGMRVEVTGAKVRMGISCALCHSTVDPETQLVVHGAPNNDFNAGLMMALATNTATFFAHTAADPRTVATGADARTVPASDGSRLPLPDPAAMEAAVDAKLLKWPPGSFDSVGDLIDNPTNNPDSFTWGDHPYNWSGAFIAGPFRGLSVQTNNVHALNSDPFTQADGSRALFGIDPELYYAVLLQNAASEKYRYDPAGGKRPSEFFRSVDPTDYGPGLNQMVALPTYPKASLIEPTGLWCSDPGRPVWQKVNAMSAWQNTLVPPAPSRVAVDPPTTELGRRVFERANCASCHSGPALTNNRVVSNAEVKAQPRRARGLKATENAWSREAFAYAFDQSVPLPDAPRVVKVPTEQFDPEQVKLAFAHGDSPGGYKTPSLIGLYWSAPYLHDGGVSVGADAAGQLGVPGTVKRTPPVPPDPYNSLKALLDRDLRARMVAANRGDPDLVEIGVEGIGHAYWADGPAGVTADEQRALILYLLAYRP